MLLTRQDIIVLYLLVISEMVYLFMFVLQAANCVAAPQVYCQLLAIYLLQRDL